MYFKVNKRKFYIATAIITAVIALLIFTVIIRNKDGEINSYECTASFKRVINKSDFMTDMKMFLHINQDGTAHMDLIGIVNHNQKNSHVARAYDFNYKKQNADLFHLTDIHMSKRINDNVNDEIMDRMFFSYKTHAGRYVKMQKIKNAFIVSNLYTPLFICVVS